MGSKKKRQKQQQTTNKDDLIQKLFSSRAIGLTCWHDRRIVVYVHDPAPLGHISKRRHSNAVELQPLLPSRNNGTYFIRLHCNSVSINQQTNTIGTGHYRRRRRLYNSLKIVNLYLSAIRFNSTPLHCLVGNKKK